jgi:uncharacterized protein YlxW (UPF0749 family)
MTNKKIICLVLGIMCFILTVGICVQIKTVKYTNSEVSQNYKENNLRAEVLKYKEKYENKIKDIEKIDKELEVEIAKATENNSELEDAQNQIIEGNKIIGLSEVTGNGVIIKVEDSDADTSNVIDASDFLVHDKDILKIVNELKNAGAEAISINNQRIVSTTSIICGGNIININGERIGSPFEIKAIGLPETLANLNRPGGVLEELKNRKIKVDLKKMNNNDITIPKYAGVLNFKYVKNVD